MALGKIIVETTSLDTTATKVQTAADQYKTDYTTLFSEVEALAAAWSGEDNTAFTQQVEGFRDDFTKMYDLMVSYSTFLKATAETYRTTQDEIMAKAKTLMN